MSNFEEKERTRLAGLDKYFNGVCENIFTRHKSDLKDQKENFNLNAEFYEEIIRRYEIFSKSDTERLKRLEEKNKQETNYEENKQKIDGEIIKEIEELEHLNEVYLPNKISKTQGNLIRIHDKGPIRKEIRKLKFELNERNIPSLKMYENTFSDFRKDLKFCRENLDQVLNELEKYYEQNSDEKLKAVFDKFIALDVANELVNNYEVFYLETHQFGNLDKVKSLKNLVIEKLKELKELNKNIDNIITSGKTMTEKIKELLELEKSLKNTNITYKKKLELIEEKIDSLESEKMRKLNELIDETCKVDFSNLSFEKRPEEKIREKNEFEKHLDNLKEFLKDEELKVNLDEEIVKKWVDNKNELSLIYSKIDLGEKNKIILETGSGMTSIKKSLEKTILESYQKEIDLIVGNEKSNLETKNEGIDNMFKTLNDEPESMLKKDKKVKLNFAKEKNEKEKGGSFLSLFNPKNEKDGRKDTVFTRLFNKVFNKGKSL